MNRSSDCSAVEWPEAEDIPALRALVAGAGLPWTAPPVPARGACADDPVGASSVTGDAVFDAATAAGLDCDIVDVPGDDPLPFLRRASPLLVRRPGRGLLALVRLRGGTATLMGRTGPVSLPAIALEEALAGGPHDATEATDAAVMDAAARACVRAALPAERRSAAARLLMAPTRAGRPAAVAWVLRPASAGMKADLRAARVFRRVGAVVAGYLIQVALLFAIWRDVGARSVVARGARAGVGTEARGWTPLFVLLTAWVLAQITGSVLLSRLTLDLGASVRRALLRGALRLDPGRMRVAGVGQLLGRALDAEALDALALGGGVEAVAGCCELILGAVVLAWGVAPGRSLAAVALAIVVVWGSARVHARRLAAWNQTRRGLTHELVERMIGHRTVLVQDRPAERARHDDAALTHYDARTAVLDRAEIWLAVLVPRAWLLGGLALLAPAALVGASRSGAGLAISLGGVWLVYGSLRRLGLALPVLSSARQAWARIVPLVGAPPRQRPSAEGPPGDAQPSDVDGGRDPTPPPVPSARTGGTPARADRRPAAAGPTPLLETGQVSFRYPDRSSAILAEVNLLVVAGDRVLIEGASGGGKSTLGALMTGLKVPTTGTLRLRGVDQRVLGLERWRAAVGGAPQFHDNHVFGTDLLFNLVMGRRWPPRLEDAVAAEEVCRELGLGELLDRMPGGLSQQVGETGWQLSHGERSRLFIARSLLQMLQVRVLDESFAALDPETLDQVMAAVLRRPEALIVIAHP